MNALLTATLGNVEEISEETVESNKEINIDEALILETESKEETQIVETASQTTDTEEKELIDEKLEVMTEELIKPEGTDTPEVTNESGELKPECEAITSVVQKLNFDEVSIFQDSSLRYIIDLPSEHSPYYLFNG